MINVTCTAELNRQKAIAASARTALSATDNNSTTSDNNRSQNWRRTVSLIERGVAIPDRVGFPITQIEGISHVSFSKPAVSRTIHGYIMLNSPGKQLTGHGKCYCRLG